MRRLVAGELEIICAVDVFNEGLDVPNINTVVMLRPTQSPVIFLQQLGRGLRTADHKPHLTVVDFIGNHRSFLQKPQALLYLTGEDLPPAIAVAKIARGELDLPDGCRIDIETDALDLLAELTKVKREDALLFEYVTFRDAHGRRPTASELLRSGLSFDAVRKNYGGWFEFVNEQGDLEQDETRALASHGPWLRDVLTTRMTNSYKLVALQALIDADALFGSVDVEANARRSNEIMRSRMLLYKEMCEDESRRQFGAAFIRKWREMPLRIWAKGASTGEKWFRLEGDTFASGLAAPDDEMQDTIERMTEELVELRLHEHEDCLRRKQPLDATQAPILLVVSHANRRPILRFDRGARGDIPEGDTTVVVDGQEYVFRFKQIAVNVVSDRDTGENVLAALMRSWFGPTAGQPGTRHRVQLVRRADDWQLRREQDDTCTVVPVPTIPFYPDLDVACGSFKLDDRLSEAKKRIAVNADVTLHPIHHFVVRASGDSMDGGDAPIRDGDLVLCKWLTAASGAAVEGRPHLLVGHDSVNASFAALKIPVKRDGRWLLRSANPAHEDRELPQDATIEPVARVLGPVSEHAGLLLWGEYDRDAIAVAFGSTNNPSWQVGHRDIDVHGEPHTILMVKLRKSGQTRVEHRYADRFLSREEFQWESQASTKLESAKGRRITGHAGEGRAIHLFVRESDRRRAMIYCGRVNYLRHDGEQPMRVWFELERALPEGLWRLWQH